MGFKRVMESSGVKIVTEGWVPFAHPYATVNHAPSWGQGDAAIFTGKDCTHSVKSVHMRGRICVIMKASESEGVCRSQYWPLAMHNLEEQYAAHQPELA